MKKIQVFLLASLSAALLLGGCGKSNAPEETSVTTDTTEVQSEVSEPSTEEAATEAVDTELPPQEGMVRSTLTNDWIDGSLENARPIAVMIPNDSSALPHYGLSQADILYECPVEGSITRLMAVVKDWESIERLGNVRSCRDYFVYWAFEYDAIYCHFGGPFYINEVIERTDTDNITGCSYGDKRTKGLFSDAYYRASDRKAPQNAYTSGEGINKAITKLGFSKTYRDGYYDANHFTFASNQEPNTLEQYSDQFSASKIDLSSAYPISQTFFTYNESDGLYYRSEYGKAHVDAANDNAQLAFKNVLVQFTYHEVRDAKGYLSFQVHDTSRDGYYFTNGKGIHVTWKKTSDYGPTKYYDDLGNEIQLNTGKTNICIVEENDSITVEDDMVFQSDKAE